MLNKYDKINIRLMFKDTDSLFYETKTADVYKDLYPPKNSKYYSEENKKVIEKMKDEAAGVPIKEFVGLRSKMYSYCLDYKCIKMLRHCKRDCQK